MKNRIKPKNKKELIEVIRKEMMTQGVSADLNHIDVSEMETLSYLFSPKQGLRLFNGDVSQWDVSRVKEMDWMFSESEFNGDLSKWDVSSVRNMGDMFFRSSFQGDISKWEVSNVKDMRWMFAESQWNRPLEEWTISADCKTQGMFDDSALLNQLIQVIMPDRAQDKSTFSRLFEDRLDSDFYSVRTMWRQVMLEQSFATPHPGQVGKKPRL